MNFKKMHGLGNDFVIFDARAQDIILTPDDMALVADRRWGVGCDTLVILDVSETADIAAYFFNADGSESGACGNATRCVADMIMTEQGTEKCSIEVTYGILNCIKKGDQVVQVDMGAPKHVKDLNIALGRVSNPVSVDVGNPHCVFFVDKLEGIAVEELGAYFETHEKFPNRTNVEFVQVISRTHLRQITWERGVGLTEACGSGACAAAVAALHRGLVDKKVEVELEGGILTIEQSAVGAPIFMTGPVAYVFDGTLYG